MIEWPDWMCIVTVSRRASVGSAPMAAWRVKGSSSSPPLPGWKYWAAGWPGGKLSWWRWGHWCLLEARRALERRGFTVWLCNARHVKKVPGRKTDLSDAEWLADVAAHGMVRPSFVPPPPIRELRELTRYRKTQIDARVAEIQRLEKVDQALCVACIREEHDSGSGDDLEAALAQRRDVRQAKVATASGSVPPREFRVRMTE